MAGVRALVLIGLVALVGLLMAACGGDESKPSAAPGSPENPLVAQPEPTVPPEGRSNEAAGAGEGGGTGESAGSRGPSAANGGEPATPQPSGGSQGSESGPGYEQLLEGQSQRPRSRFTPCNLVSKAQATSIVGAPLQDPLEAPQGPTCIYRTHSGKGLVTLAVQSVDFKKLRSQLRQPQRLQISQQTAYCGQYGQAMLYVPLSRGRVLSIAAPCKVAKEFAATALRQLPA